MINEINVYPYEEPLGGNEETHALWKEFITNTLRNVLVSADLQKIDMYNMIGRDQDIRAGRPNRRFVVYADSRFKGSSKENYMDETGLVINGIKFPGIKETYPYLGGGTAVIKSEEGIPLAEYRASTEEMVILIDLFKEHDENRQKLFTYIIEQLEKEVFFKKKLESSWLHTSDKEKLTKSILDDLKKKKSEELRREKRRLGEYEEKIENYRREIKRVYDALLQLRRNIENEEDFISRISEQFFKDLDLIVAHPKIKDLHIKDGIFEFFTDDIYAYTKKDERFYIGKFKVTMNLENSDVRFFNLNNRRKGYWTQRDHHPHVNGENGIACLGSVASTIAELCSQMQTYALALVCIDFLENANIEDPAGNKVYNWDMVDEDGNIIREGGRNDITWSCDYCGDELTDEDDQFHAIREVDEDGEPTQEYTICEDCRDMHFYFSDHYDTYVHEDIDDEEDE